MGTTSHGVLHELGDAYGWICCYCDVALYCARCEPELVRVKGQGLSEDELWEPWPITREHIIPKALGGSERRSNIAASCQDCNNNRGDKTVAEFLEVENKKRANVVGRGSFRIERHAPNPPGPGWLPGTKAVQVVQQKVGGVDRQALQQRTWDAQTRQARLAEWEKIRPAVQE